MSTPIRTILVDDEPPARERLASLLAVHPEIDIVGEAGDVETANEVYQRERPDLVFLDIQLPRASGFDLIPMLDGLPAVIFVTAYDEFALQAFEVNALDYLLKPVHPARLAAAVKRVRISPDESGSDLQKNGHVALQEDSGLRFVPLASISFIEAQGNYTQVHLMAGLPGFVRRPLADWKKLLPESSFLRLGRSLLVQIAAIRSVEAASRDVTRITLAGSAKPILIGRRAGLLVRRALNH